MLTIHKFKLEGLSGTCKVHGLVNILSIQEQEGVVTAWCLVDTDGKSNTGFLWSIEGTGWELDRDALRDYKHKDTIVTKQGFVWHVFIQEFIN